MFPQYVRLMREGLLPAIQTIVGAATVLHLYKNDVVPNGNSIATDFTVADFTDYAGIVATDDLAIGVDPVTGEPTLQWLDGSSWVVGASPTPQTIYGWMLFDTAGTFLVAAGRLDTPIEVNETGDVVSVPAPQLSFKTDILQN